MGKALFSKAFWGHEWRLVGANASLWIFLCFGWALAALMSFYGVGFMLTNRTDASVLMSVLPWVLALLVPALAMGAWAQDFRNGTAERLLSLPVPLSALYLTRFLVLWGVIGIFLLGQAPFYAMLFWLGSPDVGPLVSGLVGMWLLGGVLLAMSLWIGVLSGGFIAAFLGGFLGSVVLLVSGWGQVIDMLQGIAPDSLLVALQSVSLIGHLKQLAAGLVAVQSIAFIGILLVGFLVLGLWAVHRRAQQNLWQQGRLGVVVIMAMSMAMGVATTVDGRLDVTEEGLFTLSPATRGVIKALPAPVELVVYDSRSNPEAPLSMLPVRQRLRDLLADVVRVSDGKVKVTWQDPWRDLQAQLRAGEAGLQPLENVGNQPTYMGLVASMGERMMAIPSLDYARLPYMEFDVASLLSELQKTRRKNLTVLSGINLSDPKMTPTWLVQLGDFYNVQYALPGAPQLPANTDVVVVFPSTFLPLESLYALDQYMVAGGKALVLVDPYLRSAPFEALLQPDRNADAMGTDHVADVLRGWGLTYDWNAMIGDAASATPVKQDATKDARGGQVGLGFTTYPLWLTLGAGNVNQKLPFTSYVTRLLLAEPGELVVANLQAGLTVEPILTTGGSAQRLSREQFGHTQPELAGGLLQGAAMPRLLGALVYGSFRSTFDAMPAQVAQYYADYKTVSSSIPAWVGRSSTQGAAVVVADADWVADAFALDVEAGKAVNDNLPFLYNTLQYLSGDGSMLGLRAKGLNQRPFVRVEAMLSALSARYVATEQELMGQMFALANRMAQLQSRQNASAALDEQTMRDLRALKAQELGLQQQLRDVRQDLATRLARWNHLLAWLNALLLPLLVGVFLGWRRVRTKGVREVGG